METANSGPRYAPDDPTLPEPWKGLVDGSTGMLYYWNPESGVTQYEKPSSISHTQGPQPFVSTATPVMTNSVPVEQQMQTNGTLVQRVSNTLQDQVNQQYQQHIQVVQSSPSVSQLQTQPKIAQNTPSQFTQYGHPSYQHGQLANQQHGQYSTQYPVQNTNEMGLKSQMGSQMQLQPVQNVPNLMGHNIPPQSSQMVNSQGQGQGQGQGQQFGNQQYHYASYQHNAIPEGVHGMMHQQTHNTEQVSQFSHPQEHNSGFSQRTEVGNHKKSQSEFSSPPVQQPGTRSTQNFSGGVNPVLGAGSGAHYNQQFYGHMTNLPQSISPRVQQTRTELNQQSQRGSLLQNNAASMPSPQIAAAAAPKSTFDDKIPGRAENDYFLNFNRENQVAAFQQPKMEIKSASLQNMASGNSGFAPGSNFYGNFSQATATPFSNNALLRQPQTFSHDVSNMSHADAYRRQHEITTTGENVPDPFITFEGTRFPPEILMEMNRAGFSFPTPIQAQTWPIALNNCDVVAIAKTGSGKTLGYLIPAFLLIRRQRNNPLNGPTVLVLSPTRELATQIQDEVIKFGRSSRISCTCLYGGAPKGPQLKELSSGTDIVVATPGRLNDILDMKKIVLGQISLLVLDEADRMLDMGFEPQIRRIVNGIPARRQTFMFTATWPKEVRKIAGDLLINPVQVNIGNVDELSANKSITQHVEVVSQMDKQMRLEHILRSQAPGSKIIIFCSTKRLCDQLVRVMGRAFGAAAIHGDKSQGERDWVLNQFRSGKTPILVATDVAARGLDIKDIRVVINYDFPTGIEDYVHRIGRTGRAGATGIAHTFFCDQDWKYAADLIKVLEGANQRVPPEVRDIALRGAAMASARGGGSNRGIDSEGDRSIHANNGDFTGRGGGARDGSFGGRGRGRDGGRGGRDNNFSGGRGGMDGNFGGFGMRREGDFGGREAGFGGHMRDGGFGGNNFGGQGGGYRDFYGGQGGGFRRNDFVSFPGGRSRGGFGGPGGGFSRGRNSNWPQERYGTMDGGGRGRGRGRFESRRDFSDKGRSRKYSRSPDRGRARGGGYSSRSRSRSWSRSRSRSRSRSWTPRRSRSKTRDENGRRSSANRGAENSERIDGGGEVKGAPVSTTSVAAVAVAAAADGDALGVGNGVVSGNAEAEAAVAELKDEGGVEEKVQEPLLS